jgi:hypothetical protein
MQRLRKKDRQDRIKHLRRDIGKQVGALKTPSRSRLSFKLTLASFAFHDHDIAVQNLCGEWSDGCAVSFCGPPEQVVLGSRNIAHGCLRTYLHYGVNFVGTDKSYGYHVDSTVGRSNAKA